MNAQLLEAVREITHKRTIKSMDDFTRDEIKFLTVLHMNGLSKSEQLEMVIGPNPDALLENIKGILSGEGAGAYALMDPKNLLAHDLILGVIRWAFDEIEDVLQLVLTQESHDRGVY